MTWTEWAWVLLAGSVGLALTYEFVAIAKHWLTITQLTQHATNQLGLWRPLGGLLMPVGYVAVSALLFWHLWIQGDKITW